MTAAAFVAGVFVGTWFGVLIMALMAVAKRCDEAEQAIEAAPTRCPHGLSYAALCMRCEAERPMP